MDRGKKKKKADYEALHSPLRRIPGIDTAAVRDLLDLGFVRVYELAGRAPEVLFTDLKKKKPKTPPERLWALRLAVYFAETPEPDPAKLHPWAWKE